MHRRNPMLGIGLALIAALSPSRLGDALKRITDKDAGFGMAPLPGHQKGGKGSRHRRRMRNWRHVRLARKHTHIRSNAPSSSQRTRCK